eukprot:14741950-Alexandrium_andersonii.AAC.1
MFEAVAAEIATLHNLPFMISGDLNAEPGDIPLLSAMLHSQEVHDIASYPHLTSSPQPLVTCAAHGPRAMTR